MRFDEHVVVVRRGGAVTVTFQLTVPPPLMLGSTRPRSRDKGGLPGHRPLSAAQETFERVPKVGAKDGVDEGVER